MGSCWIEDGATVLFQGDSITDASRSRSNPTDMGFGYAMMASAWFHAMYPHKNVTFVNRGISGNRVPDLLARWQEDSRRLHRFKTQRHFYFDRH